MEAWKERGSKHVWEIDTKLPLSRETWGSWLRLRGDSMINVVFCGTLDHNDGTLSAILVLEGNGWSRQLFYRLVKGELGSIKIPGVTIKVTQCNLNSLEIEVP